MRLSALRTGLAGGALVAIAALSLTGCSASPGASASKTCTPEATFHTVTPGVLTIAAIQQLPSLNVDVATGKVTGIDSVVLGGFAKANCLQVKFNPLPGPAAVAAMTEHKADVAGGGWYRTAARAKILGQTDPTWYDEVGVVAHGPIGSIDELQGKKVGIVGGSLFEGPLEQAIGKSHVVTYQSIDAIFQDLSAGRIDAAMGAGATLTIEVHDRHASNLTVSLMKPDPKYAVLTAPGEPNYPYTKGNTALGKALNAWVQKERKDGVVAKELAAYGITDSFAMNGPSK